MKKRIMLIASGCVVASSLFAGNFDVEEAASVVLVESRATPPHTVTSYVRKYAADIQLDQDSLQVSKAEFSFRLADLDSAHEKRDKKMHGWIESDKFPEIRFTLSDVKTVDGQSVGVGALSMHGVSQEIEVPFSVRKTGNTVSMDGTATFSYEDWDLEIIRLFLFRVRPELQVRFHLEGTVSAS